MSLFFIFQILLSLLRPHLPTSPPSSPTSVQICSHSITVTLLFSL
ncbi:hypothetical protein A2U01_0105915, partial [Trifolium medium]|nr:hypothetical protein [Trifolium medium]